MSEGDDSGQAVPSHHPLFVYAFEDGVGGVFVFEGAAEVRLAGAGDIDEVGEVPGFRGKDGDAAAFGGEIAEE